MTEYLDPFDYVETDEISKGLEAAIEDPWSFNYRSNDPDRFTFPPKDHLVRSATVDFANNNVEVQYNPQSEEEKYVVVVTQGRIGLVESHTNVPSGENTENIVRYHLLTPEVDLVYDGDGYTESLNDLPRNAAHRAPELIERASELEKLDSKDESLLEPSEKGQDIKTVPPPRKDPMSED